jgi:hypothetical protein
LLSFFENPRKEVKLKKDNNQRKLDEILAIALDLLNNEINTKSMEGIKPEDKDKLALLSRVLQKNYSGTKIQLKAQSIATNAETGAEEVTEVHLSFVLLHFFLFFCKQTTNNNNFRLCSFANGEVS